MATVNLGKIKLKWRGTWSSGGSYTADDVVEYTDGSVTSSFIAVASSTNQTPSTGGTVNTTYWNLLAKGQATSPTTTQGDVIVRGASADERLAIGSAGQALLVNSSGNGLEYGTAGRVLNVQTFVNNTRQSLSGTSNFNFFSVNYTQVKANSKILWWGQLAFRQNASGEVRFQLLYDGSEVNAGQSGYPYTAQSHCMYGTGCGYFDAASTTGSKAVIWRHRSNNGANENPAQRFNPNSSDDSRIAQQASVLTFMELDF
tara:strand:- start:270 stop:1043 length:774 start_codon:yes stop_codon:yes gene_type:complete